MTENPLKVITIVYAYHPELPIKATLLKMGDPVWAIPWVENLKSLCIEHNLTKENLELKYITLENPDPDFLLKVREITGWLGEHRPEYNWNPSDY